jgi:hypothetical protein
MEKHISPNLSNHKTTKNAFRFQLRKAFTFYTPRKNTPKEPFILRGSKNPNNSQSPATASDTNAPSPSPFSLSFARCPYSFLDDSKPFRGCENGFHPPRHAAPISRQTFANAFDDEHCTQQINWVVFTRLLEHKRR